MHTLSINVGSSSLKIDLWDVARGEHLFAEAARGLSLHPEEPPTDHLRALGDLLARIALSIDRVGHRIVHGGPDHQQAVWVDAMVLGELDALSPLSPVHLPPALAVLRRARELLPEAAHAAVFDTAFHAGLPPRAREYALPARWREQGIRRYGFHGLACEDIVAELGAALRQRAVVLHLGAGCSATALEHGRSVDTTMGMTPLAGLVMASRSGDVDPGALVYLLRRGESAESLDRTLNHESGLLGLSGISGDMQDLLEQIDAPEAALAVDVFCYQAAKAVAALAVPLGGIEHVIFSGGIGEHAAPIRAAIGERLAWLGLELDAAANAEHAACISSARSRVAVHVVRIDESRAIARRTAEL